MKNKFIIFAFAFILIFILFGCESEQTTVINVEDEMFEMTISNVKQTFFDQNNGDWNLANGAIRNTSLKTGKECIKLIKGSSIYNKFSISSKDKLLFLSANVSGEELATLCVKVMTYNGSAYEYYSLSLCDESLLNKVGEFYEVTTDSANFLAFDLNDFIGKEVVIIIEQPINATTSNDIYINSVSFGIKAENILLDKEFDQSKIVSSFDLRGSIESKEDGIHFTNGASFVQMIRVNSDYPYLKITLGQSGALLSQVSVLIGDEYIKPENGDTMAVSANENEVYEYVFDFTKFNDCIVTLTIKNNSLGDAVLKRMDFMASKQGYSNAVSWDAREIFYSWMKVGSVVLHKEGVCLESSYRTSSMANITKITEEAHYLNVRCRIFIRPAGQAQDVAPKVRVQVDDVLIKTVDGQEYVSPLGDDYDTFVYDLSNYIGQSVTIKISNTDGTHACFDFIYLDDTQEIEELRYESEQYTLEYLNTVGLLDNTTFNFIEDSEGWTLGTGEKKYDGSSWIESGRLDNPCIKLDGSDIGDSKDFIPNSWMIGKVNVTADMKNLYLNLSRPSDADTSLRVRVLTIEFGKIVSNYLVSHNYEKDVDYYGYYLVDHTSPAKYNFDLTDYVGQTIYLSIEQDDNGEGAGEIIYINTIKFSPKEKTVSTNNEWDVKSLIEDWDRFGNIELHSEGLCIENYEQPSSIANYVTVPTNLSTLQISFRKFIRDGVQDKDPLIVLYVNDEIVKAIGSDKDYVTCEGDAIVTFAYDLSGFAGQNVRIKIKNIEGEHACFDEVKFS